jgi:hypothetical protein
MASSRDLSKLLPKEKKLNLIITSIGLIRKMKMYVFYTLINLPLLLPSIGWRKRRLHSRISEDQR